jgi:hypothetical protein
MPVRKIPKSYRSITGRFPSVVNRRCIGYESKLERDSYLRQEFDRTISSYEEQPLRLTGIVNGVKVSYTLDSLYKYNDGKPDRLVEVKYQSELEEKAAELEPRFTLARNHASENGMDFVVVTDLEVNDGFLGNYRLIYRFTKPPNNFGPKRKRIIESLRGAGELTLKDLLLSFGEDLSTHAEYTPSIWHLLYIREIDADLSEPISYDTILRISNG